ncbi:hypothetical protein SUGI_1521750 [Cryptomeria japonica]|uniref:Glycosyltransferase n=3 Tax=Cryptomeria japonica TaxID=3369 RepID=A0AAD3NUF7_CRYJA|nr:hypothetical protein SUGI_1521750 [Cryptomeria japonica]
MPHALLIPFPAQGHINPMMQLAWKLVSDGFFITFLNTDVNHQRIIKANKDKDMQNNGDKIRMISVPGGLPPKKVAELHHISLAGFHTSLVSTFAIRYFSPKLVSLGILPSDGIPEDDMVQKYLPSMPPLQSAHLPWFSGGEYLFRHGIRMAKEVAKIEWILFNTIYELEGGVADDLSREMGVFPIGPLISPEFLNGDRKISTTASIWEDNMECLEWLEKQCEQSVIYVAFGSHGILNNQQVEELALGLEAAQRPFLWVVHSDVMNGTIGGLPAGFLDRVDDRGCIVSWAPQLRVLSHPSIACFVTHCGWNSVQESITMGVPMLCWPHFGDQFINSTYVVHVWKVGLPLKLNNDGLIEKEEFRRAIERLVATEEGRAIREEMKKWNSIARNTVKEGGLSSTNYNLFVKAMMK